MAKNEVGEFELVLGNKQLLSVFFIVVILLGVFFTMGYIVGQNSGGLGRLEATKTKPTVIDSPSAAPPTQVATATDPAPAPVEKPEPKKEEPAVTAPVRAAEEPKPAPKAEEKKKAAEAEKKDEKKPKHEKVEPPAAAPASNGAIAGTYLQLAAVPKAEADLLISVLRKKGFSAAAGPGPEGSNLFRVLVGPLAGSEAISQTRTSLNDAGMPGSKAIVKRF
ncbi:MAG TPA: SPOR domain-containing protein [Bryobacteraceae bacterium]|jgi:cell division septation protein DedD